MAEPPPRPAEQPGRLMETLMRYAPAAAALSLALGLTASVSWGQVAPADPRAEALIAEGRAALGAGDTDAATDAFEAALTIDPGHVETFVYLADAARADMMQGKAIRYYREALERDPRNLRALAGEGAAFAEKGATEKARLALEQLRSLCGEGCPETKALSAAIAAGPLRPVQTADAAATAPGTPPAQP